MIWCRLAIEANQAGTARHKNLTISLTDTFSDELGYSYLEDGQDMDVHDLHATMLRLCGIDHTRLTVRYQGRDFRLTDVHGRVIDGICA